MPADLQGVHAKIDRAYEHLEALDAEVQQFVHRYPFGLHHQSQNSDRRFVGTLDIYRSADPAQFGLLIGDCVHNLRSALDHLVFAVARDALDGEKFTKYEGSLSFPICSSQETWDDAIDRHRLEGMGNAAREAIRLRQPYVTHNPAAQAPLALLQSLDNKDKHRLINAVAGYVQGAEAQFEPALIPGQFAIEISPGPYTQNGATVYTLDLANPTPHMQVKFQVAFQLLLKDFAISDNVLVLLLKAGQFVQRIVAEVTKTF
jgi:hypothetical protein